MMGDYQPTRGPNRLAQPRSADNNIYESSSMPIVKGMDQDETISEALHRPPEEGIN